MIDEGIFRDEAAVNAAASTKEGQSTGGKKGGQCGSMYRPQRHIAAGHTIDNMYPAV
jgi:hypothetical protein